MDDACWMWAGSRQSKGYGQVRREGRNLLAHRAAYEAVNGPIPEGLELDHLCRNRLCYRPTHLEAVTHQVNVLRGEGIAAQYAKRDTCKAGHSLTGTNLLDRGDGRICRECQRRYKREYARRKRARG